MKTVIFQFVIWGLKESKHILTFTTKMFSSSLCTCLHHMVILRTRNKITDFFMILAWASPFNTINTGTTKPNIILTLH